MLPDTETLKSLLSDLQTSGAGSRLRVATRTIESMRVELLAEVIRLRERLATVEKERDDIRIGYNNTTWERAKARDERDEARAEAVELRARIDLALQILDDPADESDGICRATEALWGEKPEVPPQVGDDE